MSAEEVLGTLYGKVNDDQGVLAGATVFLIKDMTTQAVYRYTVTNDKGEFSITAPSGDYVLGVRYVGYKLHGQRVHIAVEKMDVGTITLQKTEQELQTVVVQGQMIKAQMKPDGFVVDVKELRERTNDALNLLKFIPRVQVKGDKLSVNGKEKVLVKIDNVLQRVDASEIASVLKGYDAGLIDQVEVVTQPPLRYDPNGNAAMIILHTSNVFKEYMGGTVGTEEMWGSKDNYRYGGYGSLLYNHRGLFAYVAPSINYNGSEYLERQTYQADGYQYKVRTPSTGTNNYKGVRGTLQYEYGDKKLIGLALAWNKKKYDNRFESSERTLPFGETERVVDNQNNYLCHEPRLTATAYWETVLGKRGSQVWTELSYFNLKNNSTTDYAGSERPQEVSFLEYTKDNDIKTSGAKLNHDYTIYLDEAHNYLLETGVSGAWSSTTNYRTHDESRNQYHTLNQKNDIRWNEFIVTPYVSGTIRFASKWWMRAGLRYSGTQSRLKQIGDNSTEIPRVSNYYNAWLPTLHATYSPSSRHQVAFTFNSSIEQPKFKDLNPFVWQINEHTFYKGNTTLHPQRSYTMGLGYTFMSALYFRGSLKSDRDMITPVSIMKGDKIYTQVENAQNSLFLGLEAGYYFDKLNWMSASIDSYYGRNKYTSDSHELLPESHSNEWGMNGYLEFTFNKKRTWTGYVSGEYAGRKQTTVSIVDPHYDFGLGVSCYLLKRRLAISLAGMSLLSSTYKGVGYREGYTITFRNKYNYPTAYLSVSYKFSNGKDQSSSRSQRTTQDIERRF